MFFSVFSLYRLTCRVGVGYRSCQKIFHSYHLLNWRKQGRDHDNEHINLWMLYSMISCNQKHEKFLLFPTKYNPHPNPNTPPLPINHQPCIKWENCPFLFDKTWPLLEPRVYLLIPPPIKLADTFAVWSQLRHERCQDHAQVSKLQNWQLCTPLNSIRTEK